VVTNNITLATLTSRVVPDITLATLTDHVVPDITLASLTSHVVLSFLQYETFKYSVYLLSLS
jgi:hypothetical protein